MKRILLADDEESLLLACQKILHGPGVQIDAINSASDAKDLLIKHQYDAVLVDLRLTGTFEMDGLEIISGAKKLYPSACVIALTAFSDSHIREVVAKAGASFCFEKPVSLLKIKNLLKTLGLYSN